MNDAMQLCMMAIIWIVILFINADAQDTGWRKFTYMLGSLLLLMMYKTKFGI